ncbi:MAG: SNF2-related protein [Micromonosporaceae bacterium]
MQRVVLPVFDHTSLESAAGPSSYARGVQYQRQRAVVRMWWDDSEGALHGNVRGRTGEFYTTTAYLSDADGDCLRFEEGHCSCPVGFDCKHVVALVLTAADASPAAPATRQSAQPVAWEQSLRSLLEPRNSANAGRSAEIPLAIELTLVHPGRSQAYGPAPDVTSLRLSARLVHPGKNGGWAGGTLSWGRLDSLHYYGGYSPGHVRLLQEIYAVYRSRRSAPAYYSYGEDKSIDLSAFESRQLWPLLDEAEAVGLRLVHGRKLGAVERYRCAELCLDVTRGGLDGPLVVAPVIRVDAADAGGPSTAGADGKGTEAALIRFIGTDGHGLVHADPTEIRRSEDHGSWRFRLAKLTTAVPPQLQRMALANQRLEIPAAQQARFAEEYYPRLRQTATVISSDGSFTPPVIPDPVLVLRACFGAGHSVDVSWEWAYQIGDSRFRVPAHPGSPGPGYRDLDAERRVLASLEVPLDRYGLLQPDRSPAAPGKCLGSAVRLGGMDTMRFTTELLPLLEGQPGIAVEVTGDPARYREAGDTLRIGVSAGDVGDTDWFDLGITITVEGRQVPFTEVFSALSRGESHLLLAGGAYFSLDKPELQALARLIEEARTLQDAPGGGLKISRFQVGLWRELTELGVISHQAKRWQEQVEGLLSLETVEPTAPPIALTARLRPYQLDGFGWLTFLLEHQLGGILADDMGLGKTLQSLALICHAKHASPAGPPFLVVAPTSVAPNWAAESARFTPDLRVTTVTDTAARRGQPLAETVADADVVVTSYTLLRIEFDAYAALDWSGLILDEAQCVKNHQSKIYQCARRLSAPVKFAITGTPMENNLMELWSLLSITAPGLFPNPERFRDYYARPIERQGQAELLGQLRRRIKPLVKRRTKEQVAADLPAKQEQVLEVDLHPRHRKLYETHLQRERQKVLGLIGDMNANRFTVLRSLTLLRQLSLHAGLVDGAHQDLPCSKIDTLLEQLRDVAVGGHRALVFSQFTKFLGKVRGRLDAAGLQYCYLDGKTRNRAAVLQRFKDGAAPVFLISLKAGGFGLNLTEADYCFLLDPWWNPATEAQAVDRVHRIGQARTVMVYRLIASGTIEEKVMALKARKAELFSSVIDNGNIFGSSLDADDIRALFT